MCPYEAVLWRAIPADSRRALEVGCGEGHFARRLAERIPHVDAVDRVDLHIGGPPHLHFWAGDFASFPLPPPEDRYDFVCAIASLHHLPLVPALERMKEALRPGGVLGIVGMFRDSTVTDWILSATAFPISRGLRLWRKRRSQRAPMRAPTMPLDEIRRVVERVLPRARFERRLLWRYTLVWTKPADQP